MTMTRHEAARNNGTAPDAGTAILFQAQCPRCTRKGVPARLLAAAPAGGVLCDYRCAACGDEWSTGWATH